ncbi:MAG: hypothetical protein MJZ46_04095, partial [Bacteroidales bacterium]|nr:hypothetical protein [Bacteroidales bacterium]
MKKLTLFCMMALVLTVISCKKEKETEKGFRATTESHAVVGNGKTHLEGLNVEWTTDDIILVFSGTCSDGMRFQTNDNGTTAEFNAVGTLPDNFYTAPYQAFYPTDAFRVRDNDILLSLQNVQPYEANGFANNSNPMVAVSNDTYLPFRNVCGILRLNLYSETRPEIQEILITSNDDNENLWGNGRVTISNGIPSLGSLSSGRNSVTLTCDGVRLGRDISNATEFNIILPPGTLSRGFNVKVTDMDGNVYERTAYGDQNTIARNEIKIMPALEVNTETPEPPAADLPKVKTAGIDNITTNSATGGGNVTADGGFSVTARGICWSTSQNPTISNNHTTDGTGLGSFLSSLTGLTANTTYYVRAYA